MGTLNLVINNKRTEKTNFFLKHELQTILNIYAKMVSNGSWKDYSFTIEPTKVSFNIYLRSSEKPFYRITKKIHKNIFSSSYILSDKDGNTIDISNNLTKLLTRKIWNNIRVVK